MTNQNILSVLNLCAERKTGFIKKTILQNISFEAKSGNFTAVTGPNGAGKSTLFSLLSGIEEPNLFLTNGEILINNKEISQKQPKERAKIVALLSQKESNAWNLSISDYLLTGRFPYTNAFGSYAKEDKLKVEQILEELNLSSFAEKHIFNLSGGEFQKIRIARALIQEPKVLILDEPVENLDFNFQEKILSFIKKVCQEKNIITIVSIHDLNLVPLFADKLLLLDTCSENCQKSFFDEPEKILKPEILNSIYSTSFGVFEHPVHHIPQLYIKRT